MKGEKGHNQEILGVIPGPTALEEDTLPLCQRGGVLSTTISKNP